LQGHGCCKVISLLTFLEDVPGDPKKNSLLSQMAEAIPQGWLGAMRTSLMICKTRKEAKEDQDNLRANELESYY
jgi:hypothetical protein